MGQVIQHENTFDLFTLMQREEQEVLHEGGSKVREGERRRSSFRGSEGRLDGGERGGKAEQSWQGSVSSLCQTAAALNLLFQEFG